MRHDDATPIDGLTSYGAGGGRYAIERQRVPVSAAPQLPAIVPWLRQIETSPRRRALPGALAAPPELAPEAQALADGLEAVLGRPFPRAAGAGEAIVLALDSGLGDEEFQLDTGDHVRLAGGSPRAVAYAGAVLLQLAGAAPGSGRVPQLALRDRPECSYRGLLVDVARHPHAPATLRRLLELCRLYRINHLQLHLSDDQAFTFPSSAFPRAATAGRGYARAELRALADYAQARGVTVVPEIDVPGHCGALIAALPELFRIDAQHPSTLHFARPAALAALRTIVDEVLEVFPDSPWFHLGGDECDLSGLDRHPEFQAACARTGAADARGLYGWFLGELHRHLRARGRRSIVWEGFGHGAAPPLPRDVTVMAYDGRYHAPDCLARDGYSLLNASWEPLYVVNERGWPPEQIYAWDRFTWRHFETASPAYQGLRIHECSSVLGAQMCAWEQREEREVDSLRLRLPALSERLWRGDAAFDFGDFARRLSRVDQILTHLLVFPRELASLRSFTEFRPETRQ